MRFCGLFNPKRKKNSGDTIWHIVREIKRFNTFPNNIGPKINVLARLEFELADQLFEHCTKETNVEVIEKR